MLVRDGRPILVWQGIPGEIADVRLEHRGPNQDLAHWVHAQEADPDRVVPPCTKYSPCGGCPFMHLTPQGQERGRLSLLRDALAGAGVEDVAVGQVFGSPDGTSGFRHVIKVAIGLSDNGHLRLGAWGRRDRHVIPIPDCPVAAPVLKRVMGALAYHVIDLDLQPFEPETGRGVLRVGVLRSSRTTGEVLVTLVAGRFDRALSDLAERLEQSCSEIAGVWLHLNEGPGNAIFSRDDGGLVGVRALGGKGFLEERLNGVTYFVGPGDFFQTNPAMAEVLYARTLERLSLEPGVPFVDLYSGVGGLALPAARLTGWALGVEEVEGAVLRARDAARHNGVSAEFVAEQVEVALPDIARRLAGTRPVVAVNPARRGLEPGVVEGILRLLPRRVAYVSCNPRALARDIASFRAGGLEATEIDVFDMFPNTPHMEALVVLKAADAADVGARRAPRRKVVGSRAS